MTSEALYRLYGKIVAVAAWAEMVNIVFDAPELAQALDHMRQASALVGEQARIAAIAEGRRMKRRERETEVVA